MKRSRHPVPLAEIVSGLVTPACRRRGVASSALVLDPVELFGERLAAGAQVERIVWPKGSRIDGGADGGATLVVAATGASALMLQHVAPQIVERANLMIGWPAIAHVRVTQARRRARRAGAGPPPTAPPPPRDEAAVARHADALGDIAHAELRDALARLAAGIERRSLSQGRKHP